MSRSSLNLSRSKEHAGKIKIFVAKQRAGLASARFMSRFSVYPHILTHSVSLQGKNLSQTKPPTFQPPDPLHTLNQELLNPINLLNIWL